MPCTAPSRNNLKVQGPCGFETYVANLCKPHWQLQNGLIPNGIDAQTVLCLHCDGADASTTFPDASGYRHQFIAPGTAKVSTAQSKFGGASLFCDGAGTIETPDAPDLEFGSGDFTIDFWVQFSGAIGTWVGHKSNGTTGAYGFAVTGGVLGFFANSVSASWDIANNVSCGAVVTGQWYHIAVTRSGSTWRTFRDGVVVSTFTGSAAVANTADPHRWGGFTIGSGMIGWMDEIRISVGVARWTSNFSVPTAPYT